MAPGSPSLARRAARTALLTIALATSLLWAIPHLAPRLFGRGLFLRQEFLHPAAYHDGGLTVAGQALGGRTVDCTRRVILAPSLPPGGSPPPPR